MKRKIKKEEKLFLLKQTRPRDINPRSTVFEDKSKFKRSRQKVLDRKTINNNE